MEFVPENGPDQPEAVLLSTPEDERVVLVAEHGQLTLEGRGLSRGLRRYRARDEAAAQAWARHLATRGQQVTVARDHLGWRVDRWVAEPVRNHLERRAD